VSIDILHVSKPDISRSAITGAVLENNNDTVTGNLFGETNNDY
jgi:hypothetical protein